MARDPGAHQGTGSRSQASPCLLAHRAERMGRAADRHRSTGGRNHALSDPYGGEKLEKKRLFAAPFPAPRPFGGGEKNRGGGKPSRGGAKLHKKRAKKKGFFYTAIKNPLRKKK